MTQRLSRWALALAASTALGCATSPERRFALRDPVTVDTDLQSVSVPCHKAPNEKDPKHVSCAPAEYVSPLIWDGADNLVFRPFAEVWAFRASTEAANANSLDEVADSAWFRNRIGVRPVSAEELKRGACEPSQRLDPDAATDGECDRRQREDRRVVARLPREHQGQEVPLQGRHRRARKAERREHHRRRRIQRRGLLHVLRAGGVHAPGASEAEARAQGQGQLRWRAALRPEGARSPGVARAEERRQGPVPGLGVVARGAARTVPLCGHSPRRSERRDTARPATRASRWPRPGGMARSLRCPRAEQHGYVDLRRKGPARRLSRARFALLPRYERLPRVGLGLGAESRDASATRTSSTGSTWAATS